MCNIGEALFKEGKAKGKAEGIKIGEKKGKAEGIEIGVKKGIVKGLLRAIVSIVKHYGVTNEQAMADLGIPENKYEEYNKLLENEGLALT
jgi:predicted transposase YdaD